MADAGIEPQSRSLWRTTARHFRRVKALYEAACQRTAEERAALLAAADPDVRREVESLLQQRGGNFLERPAIYNAAHLLDESTLDGLPPDSTLGPYPASKASSARAGWVTSIEPWTRALAGRSPSR